MGAFSNVDYELQNNEAAVSNAFMEDDDMDMPQTVPAEPVPSRFMRKFICRLRLNEVSRQ